VSDIGLLIGVAAVAFVSTNIDNLLVLTALLAASPMRILPVLAGYGAASLIIVAVAWLAAGLGDLLDTRYVGLLGLIPVALGLRGLLVLIRDQADIAAPRPVSSGAWRTAAVIVPLSGDSIAVYVPLIADTDAALEGAVIITLLSATILVAAAARSLVARPSVQSRIGRLGERIMPWLMIAVGVHVLADTPTDVFLG
jgi:cadmium resistance protein CadD (predicted permease)